MRMELSITRKYDTIRRQIGYLKEMESRLRDAEGNNDPRDWLDTVAQICFMAMDLPEEERNEIFRAQIDALDKFNRSICKKCNGNEAYLLKTSTELIGFQLRQMYPDDEHIVTEEELEAYKDEPLPDDFKFMIWNDEETGEIVLALTKDEPLRLSSKEARALARTLFRRSNKTMSIPRDDSNAGSLSLLRNRPQEKKQSQELHHSSRLDDTAMLQLLPNHQAACHESQQRIQGLKVSASPEPYNLQQ